MVRPRSTCGFTLVELLVVIGIIGVLITLLMPTISRATAMAREHMTRSIIKELEVGLEAFKFDFKVYPTSKPHASPASALDRRVEGERRTGAANLAYYLLGPGRSGWGIAGGGLMPFSNARPRRSYGPYFQADEDAMRYSDHSGEAGQVAGFLDAFSPPGVILYFSGWKDADGETHFYRSDGESNSDEGRENYDTDERFKQCVKGEGEEASTPYLRQDYFLVSPGLDGRYGAIIQNEHTGEWSPTDLHTVGSHCDDVGNWKGPWEK